MALQSMTSWVTMFMILNTGGAILLKFNKEIPLATEPITAPLAATPTTPLADATASSFLQRRMKRKSCFDKNTGYKYQGCYKPKKFKYVGKPMTIMACYETCKITNYTYFGLRDRECRCGTDSNGRGRLSKYDEHDLCKGQEVYRIRPDHDAAAERECRSKCPDLMKFNLSQSLKRWESIFKIDRTESSRMEIEIKKKKYYIRTYCAHLPKKAKKKAEIQEMYNRIVGDNLNNV